MEARFTAPVQTGPGTHPASCTMGTGKVRPGRDADHSTPSSAEVLKEWSYTSTPLWVTNGPATGLLYLLVPICFQSSSSLVGLAWSILWICPSHLILCALMNLTLSAPSVKLSISVLFRILHILSILTGPNIFLNTLRTDDADLRF